MNDENNETIKTRMKNEIIKREKKTIERFDVIVTHALIRKRN